jgi:hypothetical protein
MRYYGSDNNPNNVDVSFNLIAGISRFARYPKSNDDRILLKLKKSCAFDTSPRIQKISNIKNVVLKLQDLFDPRIKRAINAKTDAVAMKYINKYTEIKKRVKFRQEAVNE